MPNESKTVKTHNIPLNKIHDLPGVSLPQYPDRSLGGLVSSIQTGGVKEPVILRQREGGEFELLSGYRRLQASKLAKKSDIPAQVYDMTAPEATKYFQAIRTKADTPIPGKPVEELKKATVAVEKEEEKKPDSSAKPENKIEEAKKDAIPAPDKDGKTEQTAKPGPNQPVEEKGKPAAPAEKKEGKSADEKKPDSSAKPEEKKDPVPVSGKSEEKPKPAAAAKPTEKTAETGKEAATAKKTAQGPGGVAISQVFDPRLDEPDEKALKSLPLPKEGEAFFMTLHPGYLEKSVYNNFSVDKESENYKELKKAIELAGIKDPLLARPKKEGGLEILSGQRRHSIAKDLNYCVPVIVEMKATKRRWDKRSGVLGYHLIHSYSPGEVTPEEAHAAGVEFARRLLGDRYEAIVATHIDHDHFHNHIVFNSVSFVDGKKFRNDFAAYYGEIRGTSNAVSEARGLSVIQPQGKGKSYAEWNAEQHGKPTIRGMVKQDIDKALSEAYTIKSFWAALEKMG